MTPHDIITKLAALEDGLANGNSAAEEKAAGLALVAKQLREQSGNERDELAFLRWFYGAVDLGPLDTDTLQALHNEFYEKTGNFVPAGYEIEE